MNRIEQKFIEIKKKKKAACSLFLTAGYPSLSATKQLVLELAECGVDFFEIGFPFSDPIADGTTIQHSSETALRNGITWEKTMRLVKTIRAQCDVPLIFMSYSNPMYARTWEGSARQLRDAGFDGIIIPDLIPEESSQVHSIFSSYGMHLIHLLSLTSSEDRIRLIGKSSSGFVYCVSVTGVTGARKVLPVEEIRHFLSRARKNIPLPLLLGFGISKPDHLRQFEGYADGFIIGSAFIKILNQDLSTSQLMQKAKKFIQPFLKASVRVA